MSQNIGNIVKIAIQNFLTDQLNKKLEPELKTLEKVKQSADQKAISQQEDIIDQLKQKYSLEVWMADAANRMAKQLKFGTHIAKGIHPDAKGDNINFKDPLELPEALIGSQIANNLSLDANGNAAALPLASFFNIAIGDYKLRELILENHESLIGCFSQDQSLSANYLAQFKAALDNKIESPLTSELNKQILWPINCAQAVLDNNYICLVPLYPSALTNHLHRTINNARYSEQNKQARENRKKKTAEQLPYLTMHDLAYIQLGGTKPQNISQLTSSQGGRNYLLPSIPPKAIKDLNYKVYRKQQSIFNRSLRFYCSEGFKELFSVLAARKNNITIRDRRKDALDLIINTIFAIANIIQQTKPAGWSKEYALAISEKFWLDPMREDMEDEEEFKALKQQTDWAKEIEHSFSLWVNQILQKEFPEYANELNDPEINEWRKQIREAIKACRRKGQGVF